MLKIKKDGFLYKFAYGNMCAGPGCAYEEAKNLCQFGRHLFFLAPLAWFFHLFVLFCRNVVFRAFAFLMGGHPRLDQSGESLVPIQWLPKIRGHRIWPVCWIALVWGLWSGGQWFLSTPNIMAQVTAGSWWLVRESFLSMVWAIVVLCALAAILVAWCWVGDKCKELWAVISGLAKAAKQKVCPFVEFVETEVSNEQIPT